MKVSANINDTVFVYLTDDGINFIEENYPNMLVDIITHYDKIELRIQLWELMQVFGNSMRIGQTQFFEKNEIWFSI